MYYGVNKAMEELNIPASDVVFASDIGCYTLGINPPYYAADYLLSMGFYLWVQVLGTDADFQ